MILKTPSFWYRKPGLIACLLSPLSALYNWGYERSQSGRITHAIRTPVICAGNLVAGGAGKTPTAIALMKLVRDQGLGLNPFFLTRGYGGKEKGPLQVNPKAHNHKDIGDEPLLLSRTAPTIVSRDRHAGAKLAAAQGADFIIMDDGLQNPSLHKDISFVVIDGPSGFGNGKTLPAGPLREPLDEGFEKADAFILIGEDKRGIRNLLPPDKPVFQTHLKLTTKIPKDKTYLAFTGLARPQKFFEFLDQNQIQTAARLEFPDHYNFTPQDLNDLKNKADQAWATLLTTEKDQMRLPPDFPVQIAPVDLIWEKPEDLKNFLQESLQDL